ncbi:hypothetical protein AUEXF2481DRAFT_516186 [Aureobasidium subglaciale EXF-2481]|uniref:RING-type E3 ubiquitin transferase n=1 Tax=Aureobasidium subglaciale (strain EXF-2481) TaxID=1043005 RepID=A0A074YA60_AURSE|nr:uncharacterized protein AUEXF2481DRAFT_516186 [Aureobasidium subglaciale EXF-2481]KEQ91072.1 hypothetical protein AUEXF2481DRAFT_516186 [Aureobasidium subglaciale EXF-2481]
MTISRIERDNLRLIQNTTERCTDSLHCETAIHTPPSTLVAIFLVPSAVISLLFIYKLLLWGKPAPPVSSDVSHHCENKAIPVPIEVETLVETFGEWSQRNNELHPGRVPTDPLCVICIDTIEKADQISALPCLHFFHRNCFSQLLQARIGRCPVCQQAMTQCDTAVRSDPLATEEV